MTRPEIADGAAAIKSRVADSVSCDRGPAEHDNAKHCALDPQDETQAKSQTRTNGDASEKGQSQLRPQAKPLSLAKRRERTTRIHRWVRYGVQLVFFIMAPALFSGAFNGVKYLSTQIGLGNAIELTSFVVQLAAVLALTVMFGRFFCGYACAFGTLGDYLYNGFEFLRRRTAISRPTFPPKLVKVLSLLKYLVLAGICAACFAGVWASVSSDSPWVAFAAILAGSLEGIGPVALGLLVGVVILMILRERSFCQFLCPLGAVFSLMPVLGFSEFSRTRAHCAKSCGRCHAACPVDIWPDGDSADHGECISCGRCADMCPMANVNLVARERAEARAARLESQAADSDAPARPVRKTGKSWHLFRGTSVGFVIAKAVVLLVVCWLVGVARYFPPFAEVFGFNPFSF